jgi:WD and tetratricopeptide repeat-containing protein 1
LLLIYRLIKCLTDLKWFLESRRAMTAFRDKFPKHSDLQSLRKLEKELNEAEKVSKKSDAKRLRSMGHTIPDSEGSSSSNDESSNHPLQPTLEEATPAASTEFGKSLDKLKETATDFKLRFCGHCNTTTDIKEANFFGRSVENIVKKLFFLVTYIVPTNF